MKTYLESGDTFTYVAGGTVTSGDFIIKGALTGVSQDTGGSGDKLTVKRRGVFTLPKTTSQAWSQGDRVFWDSGTSKFTNDPTKTALRAVVMADALSADATASILLNEEGGLRFVSGQATTVAASDTIATGLGKVVGVVASLDSDPGDDPEWVSASVGDQNGAPVAGSFLLKTWKNTSGSDPTPVAATTFSKKVNYIAYGY